MKKLRVSRKQWCSSSKSRSYREFEQMWSVLYFWCIYSSRFGERRERFGIYCNQPNRLSCSSFRRPSRSLSVSLSHFLSFFSLSLSRLELCSRELDRGRFLSSCVLSPRLFPFRIFYIPSVGALTSAGTGALIVPVIIPHCRRDCRTVCMFFFHEM